MSPMPTIPLYLNRFKTGTQNSRIRASRLGSQYRLNSEIGRVGHVTGDSEVPRALQEVLPEKVERAVPNTIHDNSGYEK